MNFRQVRDGVILSCTYGFQARSAGPAQRGVVLPAVPTVCWMAWSLGRAGGQGSTGCQLISPIVNRMIKFPGVPTATTGRGSGSEVAGQRRKSGTRGLKKEEGDAKPVAPSTTLNPRREMSPWRASWRAGRRIIIRRFAQGCESLLARDCDFRLG